MDYKYNDFKHGQSVTCEISGSTISDAKISIDNRGRVFICQNEESGASCDDTLGYKYSWLIVSKGTDYKEDGGSVENLKLVKGKGKVKVEVIKYVVLYDNYDEDPAVKFYNRKELNKWLAQAIGKRDIKFDSIEVFEVKKTFKVKTNFRLS